MKGDWANLPQEIVLCIFQYVYQDPRYEKQFRYQQQFQFYEKKVQQCQKQLLYLQFINRNWGRAARRTLYEAISLDRSEKQVAVVLQTLESPTNKLLAQAVRKISFGKRAFPDERSLRALLKICRNVTEIATPSYDCNKLDYYYPLLSELYKEGYLQRLKKITPPGPVDRIDYQSLITKYEDAMLCLAATATKLHIDSKSEVAGGLTGLFPTVANHLVDFASLLKLDIRVSHEIPFNEVCNLFVNNQPPQLYSFYLVLDSMTPSVTYPTNNVACELSQVEEVILQLNVLSAQDLGFIMRMFPSLKVLSIEPFEQTAYFPLVNDNTSTLTFKRFSKYISRISKLDLWSCVMSPEVLLESVTSLAKFNELDNVRIHVPYSGVVDKVDLNVKKFMKEEHTCDDQDTAFCDVDLYLDFEAAYHLRLVMALLAGRAIYCLSIEAEHDLFFDPTEMKYGACLDYILNHCTTLDWLSLNCLEIDFSSNDITVNPLDKRDFSYLGLKYCQVSLDAYSCMSQRIRRVDVFEVLEGEGDDEFEGSESEGDDEDDSNLKLSKLTCPTLSFMNSSMLTNGTTLLSRFARVPKLSSLESQMKRRFKDSMTVVCISAILRRAHETFTP